MKNIFTDIYYRYKLYSKRLKTIKAYWPIIWNDADTDYVYIWILLHFKLTRVRTKLEDYKGKDRRLDITINLLWRLISNKYFPSKYDGQEGVFTEEGGFTKEFVKDIKIADRQRQQDKEYLSKMLAKWLTYWRV